MDIVAPVFKDKNTTDTEVKMDCMAYGMGMYVLLLDVSTQFG